MVEKPQQTSNGRETCRQCASHWHRGDPAWCQRLAHHHDQQIRFFRLDLQALGV